MDGATKKLYTTKDTVGDVLKEFGVSLKEHDKVTPALTSERVTKRISVSCASTSKSWAAKFAFPRHQDGRSQPDGRRQPRHSAGKARRDGAAHRKGIS
ncbi:ubiquitin-like domain-containing protein [Paenibacillus sp. FSL M7-0831]|uniref:ubiquitin-like domain-containing protein n=1 Tax=Paenibacillus sp. FSL M7-0831 TaxID=2975314 RepID=UPI0030F4B8B9